VTRYRDIRLTCRTELRQDEDNVLHVSATLEDGNVLWSSPIYLPTQPQRPAQPDTPSPKSGPE